VAALALAPMLALFVPLPALCGITSFIMPAFAACQLPLLFRPRVGFDITCKQQLQTQPPCMQHR
jgi:hypothetical protein